MFTGLLRAAAGPVNARRLAILIFSALMVPAIFVGAISSATGCIALISTATFGYSGALANLLAVPGDVFPKGAVASIWGFASMGSGIGGMIFSLVTGWLVDHYSFRPAFVLFGVIPLVAAWMVWTLPRKAARLRKRLGSRASYARELRRKCEESCRQRLHRDEVRSVWKLVAADVALRAVEPPS